jgi:tRNA(fMet)-specific endonuclease VapC
MSFLLDSNICSAHLRRPAGLAHYFMQHGGRLFTTTVVLAELYAWAFKRTDTQRVLRLIDDELLTDIQVLPFDDGCAFEFGRIRGSLLKQGLDVSPVDLFIAAVALHHDFTLVTHNTVDFRNVPNLRLADWLTP